MTAANGGNRRGWHSLTAHYAPGEERPLGAYAVLASAYVAGTGGALLGIRVCGRRLPEHPSAADVLLLGVATHKLSRLLTKDRVTSFLRAPFTRFQGPGGPGEVEEEAYGDGLREAVGELLICPYCLGQWVATGFTLGLVSAPRLTRLLSSILAVHTVSDVLQIAYRASEGAL
ncbi:MAG: DUF1360 domain-containing protein [Solirubrobacteraceae bacterium]